jgi:hypothetical protein
MVTQTKRPFEAPMLKEEASLVDGTLLSYVVQGV